MGRARLRHGEPDYLHHLCVPNSGDLQGKLRAFVLLAEDQRD